MKKKLLSVSIRQAIITSGMFASLLAGSAHGQDVSDAGLDLTNVEVIAVTGQRLANKRAIDTKRESAQVVDAIASDDIGSLPDFNVGEAVQRLPGISIQNDQGEARFISIRALNPEYNYMTVDGMSMAVPDRNGRRPYMDTLPASMVGTIEVFKSLTPDMEGTGIGGQVNLVTRSAFDFDDTFFKIRAEGGEYDQNDGYAGDDKKSGNADFVFADTFGDSNQFGLVLTGNYYKRNSYVVKSEFGNNRGWADENGSRADEPYGGLGPGSEVLGDNVSLWYKNDRERAGMSGKFEYRPNDDTQFFISGYYNQALDDEARQTDKLGWLDDFTPTLNEDGTSTSGTARGRHKIYLGQFQFERIVSGTSAGMSHYFDDNSKLEIVGNVSRSKFVNVENWNEWQTATGGNEGDIGFNYKYNPDGTYSVVLGEEASDLSNYKATKQRGLDQRRLDETINELKIDYGFNNDAYAEGWGYKVGGKYRNTDRSFDEQRSQYVPSSSNNGSNYHLGNSGVFSQGPCFIGCGDSSQGMFLIDGSLVYDNFERELALNPDDWEYQVKADEQVRNDYTINENIYAAYSMLTYAGEDYHVIFGLRYEGTRWEGTGFSKNDGTWEPVSNEGSYDDFLPSANFTYDLAEDIKLHLAYSHAIGRVPYNLMAPVGESIDDGGDDLTLKRSNPDLEARRSRNFDISVEKYFDDGEGMIAVGLFHKILKDEIFKVTENITLDWNGEETDAIATQYVNNDEDINISGLEINFIKNLTMLPGAWKNLGVSMNATWTTTDFDIADEETAGKSGYFNERNLLVGQADETYNAAIFYDDDKFSARIAYNYTGMTLTNINIKDPWLSRYNEPVGQLDAKVAYSVTDNLDISLNVWNLNNVENRGVIGRDQELVRYVESYGPAVFFGFSYVM
ncbi:TonB-dependent receptor [Shewanella sp.]|uniref:TonB-dependent receptor n=1 Tax=Shewanella sp. TaxID=50422 RepID=UPI001EC129A7|nr:TonB-dependent receptor [Shewanella sp.]NRB24511.1 TonB-dependent receptor [Shewanella sp.]